MDSSRIYSILFGLCCFIRTNWWYCWSEECIYCSIHYILRILNCMRVCANTQPTHCIQSFARHRWFGSLFSDNGHLPWNQSPGNEEMDWKFGWRSGCNERSAWSGHRRYHYPIHKLEMDILDKVNEPTYQKEPKLTDTQCTNRNRAFNIILSRLAKWKSTSSIQT